MGEKRLFALRGATQCLNSKEDIQEKVVAVYDELLSANNIPEEDIVSVFFSVTQDLDAINPATALRKEERAGKAALFVCQEAHFAGNPDRIVRILMHCYMDSTRTPFHVYRNGAEVLRPDLTGSSMKINFDEKTSKV